MMYKIKNVAAIDIGTNTLLMVVASILPDGSVKILRDEHAIARLGEGVHSSRRINEAAVLRAIEILKQYKEICNKLSVDKISVIATSAMRDAENSNEIVEKISSVIKSKVIVISGEKEANLSYRGAIDAELSLRIHSALVVDIGGGSTEIIAGQGAAIQARTSMNIGAVRIFERFFRRAIPPLAEDVLAARMFIREHLVSAAQQMDYCVPDNVVLVGVGGTFTTLAAMDLRLQEFTSSAVHAYCLNANSVHDLTEMLVHSSLDTLHANPAIHPQRADILPAGALILDEILSFYGLHSCRVSTHGLRYGVLYELVDSIKEGQKE